MQCTPFMESENTPQVYPYQAVMTRQPSNEREAFNKKPALNTERYGS